MIDFRDYDDVDAWVRRHGIAAHRALLARETMRSNSQSLASIWLARCERADSAAKRVAALTFVHLASTADAESAQLTVSRS
jgi:hypothetical protein